jgi:hypothetical protein
MKYYLNGISGITYRAKACVRMRVRERERAVMVLSPQVLVPEISISLYYGMTTIFNEECFTRIYNGMGIKYTFRVAAMLFCCRLKGTTKSCKFL